VAARRSRSRRGRNGPEAADGRPGPRPIWSGTLSFGLVAVPVDVFPAVRPAGTALRLLAPDGSPVERRYVCPHEDKDVAWDELVRGYEVAADRYVVLTDEELESVAPRRSRDIDLRRFVPAGELDPFLFERAYVLAPAGESVKPYRLLAEVLEQEDKVGIATFVLRTKEYLVAIVARDGILWAETMRFHGELRTPKEVGLAPLKHAAKAQVAAWVRAIHALEKDAISREELADRREARLQQLVERKQRQGEGVVESDLSANGETAAADGEEPDLFAAIQRSLHHVRGSRAASHGRKRKTGSSAAG
jgi:DNA end-binding protein Ku